MSEDNRSKYAHQLVEAQSEENLAERAAEDISVFWVELWPRCLAPITKQLMSYGFDPVSVKELCSRVQDKLAENIQQFFFKPGCTFRSWLFTVVKNVVKDEFRRRKRSHEVLTPFQGEEPKGLLAKEESFLHEWIKKEQAELIAAILERLPSMERRVLELCFWEDKNPGQIAAILDRTPNNVGVLKHRAKARLKRILRSTDLFED